MNLLITFEYEPETTRWLADIEALPGVTLYGNTKEEAAKNVKMAALQTLKWMVEDGELDDINSVTFEIAETSPIAA